MPQRTPLYDRHVALGARVVDFAGWDMPVQYPAGILAEHAATRSACGVFDTCHMGEFLIEGPDVPAALNRCLAGDFRKLGHGRERYTFITNDRGGVVDDAVVMLLSNSTAWIIVNAGDIPGDFAAVQAHLPAGVTAQDISGKTGKLDIQGPRAWEVVKAVLEYDLRAMPFYSFFQTLWNGHTVILSRSGYTGEPGAELYMAAEEVGRLWDALLDKGRPFGAAPCGLGARDTLRLEAGLPLYGHELTPDLNPVRAGFGRFVSLDKPEDFPGKEALRKTAQELKAAKAASAGGGEVLVGLKMEDKRSPRAGFPVVEGDKPVGRITSGAYGPTLGISLALAYVDIRCSQAGTKLAVDIRGKPAPGTVVELPFYANTELRKRN